MTSYHGAAGLTDFLAASEIVVNLLPLTRDTRDLMDAGVFAAMPAGGFVINAGRGATIVEEDLLAAVQSGQIAGAALDVFRTEPLPQDHPFWDEPRIEIWPHVAAQTNPETAIRQIADNIHRITAGQPPVNQVDFSRQY